MGVYGQRIGYDLARDVAFSASGAALAKTNPRQLGVPDNLRVDYLELDIHGGNLTSAAETSIAIDTVEEFMDLLTAIIGTVEVESTALQQVINSLSLGDLCMGAIGAFGGVDLDTDLPLPGETKAADGGNDYTFNLRVRIPFYAPGVAGPSNAFQVHQFPNGGFKINFGTGSASLGGATWTVNTTNQLNVRLVGRRTALAQFSPLRYNKITTNKIQGLEFEGARYYFLGKRDESLSTVHSSGDGQIDLFVDQDQVYAKSEYDSRQVVADWRHTRGQRADLDALLDDNTGAQLGSAEDLQLIPVVFYDALNPNPNRMPYADQAITLNLGSNFNSSSATWLTVSCRPTREIGKGVGGCCAISGAGAIDSPFAGVPTDAGQQQFQPRPAAMGA